MLGPLLSVRGDILRAVRTARGISVADLAVAVGMHRSYPYDIEQRRVRRTRHLADLAETLDVDAAVLTGQVPAIRSLREAAGLSVADLARAVGVSPSAMQRLEAGTRDPSAEETSRLARRLGVEESVLQAGPGAVAA